MTDGITAPLARPGHPVAAGPLAGPTAPQLAEFQRTPASWPTAAPVFVALEKRDTNAFRLAVSSVAAQVERLADAAPGPATLFLYDLLRSALEALRPGRGALPEPERISLITLLGSQPTPSSVLVAFLAEAERIATLLSPGRPTQHPVAQRARRFIDGHASERLSLARVARELGVTRTYLSALFRRECGVTLTEYIHHVRIERAEGLLRQGGLSMAAVAALSGYGSYRHFHRSFLKLRQVSPRAYLRTLETGPRGGSPAPPTWPGEALPLAARPPALDM